MITPEILNYIKDNLEAGHSESAIRHELVAAGWHHAQIEEAFAAVSRGVVASETERRPLPGVGELFKKTWSNYKKHFIKYIAIEILPMLILTFLGISSIIFTALLFRGDTKIIYYVYFPALLLAYLILILGQAAMIAAVHQSGVNGRVGILRAYGQGLKKLHSFIWISLCIGALAVSLVIIPVVILLMIYSAPSSMLMTAVYFIPYSIVIALVVGTIVTIRYMFASFALFNENIKGLKALIKSNYYIKGRFFAVVWRYLAALAALFIFSLAGNQLAGRLPGYWPLLPSGLVKLLSAPFILIYGYELYLGLKSEKPEVTEIKGAGQRALFTAALCIVVVGVAGIIYLVIRDLSALRNLSL